MTPMGWGSGASSETIGVNRRLRLHSGTTHQNASCAMPILPPGCGWWMTRRTSSPVIGTLAQVSTSVKTVTRSILFHWGMADGAQPACGGRPAHPSPTASVTCPLHGYSGGSIGRKTPMVKINLANLSSRLPRWIRELPPARVRDLFFAMVAIGLLLAWGCFLANGGGDVIGPGSCPPGTYRAQGYMSGRYTDICLPLGAVPVQR